MKKLFFVLLLLASLQVMAYEFGGSRLISYELYKTITKEDIQAKMKQKHVPRSLVKVKYVVDVYDVKYKTCWHDSSCIMASGLYFVPRDVKQPMATVVYHHGTRIEPGRKDDLGGEEFLCVGLAVGGYSVFMPDYIGLGYGEKFHLYQNALSLGQASVDMLFAGRELDSILHLQKNGMLFLTGYSEGGYATLATHKLIQEKYSKDFHVTASSANSGAYDMAGVQSEVMFEPYERPHYLPYLLKGINEVYALVPYDINQIYKSPYDTIIPKMFNGKHEYREIDKVLPKVPKDMIRDSFMQEYLNDPNFPLKKILKENSLIDWKPESPVQMCYCNHDEQVTYKNALVAKEHMDELGAEHVIARRAARKYGHNKCAIFASMYTKLYFDSFRNGSKTGRKGKLSKRMVLAFAKLAIKR